MTKRKVDRRQFVKCPFCGFLCTADTPFSWCSGCYVEYYYSRNGEWVVFDTERQTEKFTWAKALAKSGGVRLGKIEEVE